MPDLSITDTCGKNAYHIACLAGKDENADLLARWMEENPAIDHEDFLKQISNSGNNGLMYAVESGRLASVVACLSAGVNPFQTNNLGEAALTLAKKYPGVVSP